MTGESRLQFGIDVGKRRLAYGCPLYASADSIDLGKPGASRDAELRELQRWVCTVIPSNARLWIDQAFAGGGRAQIGMWLTETISAVMTAQEWAYAPVVVHQATWKKETIGNHMADKVEISNWLLEHYPDLHAHCHTEDEIDAMVIGLYGVGRTYGSILAPEIKKRARAKR